MTLLVHLMVSFFSIGLFSVGGGLATVPFLSDLSARTGWFTESQLMHVIAIAESTPGPIGINMATYVGFFTLDFIGAVLAPVALTIPAFTIILLIARFLRNKWNNNHFLAFFYGIRPASVGLIAAVFVSVCASTVLSFEDGIFLLRWKELCIFFVVFLCLQIPKLKHLHTIFFILLSAGAGILFRLTG